MIDIQRPTPPEPAHEPVARILDLLVATAQSQRLALELLARYSPAASQRPAATRHRRAEGARRSENDRADPPPALVPADQIGPHLVRALQALVASDALRRNQISGEVFVQDDYAALVLPDTLRAVRGRLKAEGLRLPEDRIVFDTLRDDGLALANEQGRIVKRLRVQVGAWRASDVKAIVVRRSVLGDPGAPFGASLEVAFEEILLQTPTGAADLPPNPAETVPGPVTDRSRDTDPGMDPDHPKIIRF